MCRVLMRVHLLIQTPTHTRIRAHQMIEMHLNSELANTLPDRLPLTCSLTRVLLLQVCEKRREHTEARKDFVEAKTKYE